MKLVLKTASSYDIVLYGFNIIQILHGDGFCACDTVALLKVVVIVIH